MNIRTMIACLTIPLVGVLSGCAGSSPYQALVPVPAGAVVNSPEQLEGGWVVHYIGERDVTGRYSPRIAFGKEQRVGGMAGCNRFLGDYVLGEEGEFEFGKMKLTRRICAEPIMFQEALLLNRMRSVKNGILTGDGELLLFFDERELPIRLRPEVDSRIGGAMMEGASRG